MAQTYGEPTDTIVSEAKGDAEQIRRESSDRARILLGAATVERRLKALLDLHLHSCSESLPNKVARDFRRRVGNHFGAAIDFAYCAGLVDPDRFEILRALLEIRNLVAHRVDCGSFEAEDVKKKCDALRHANPRLEKFETRMLIQATVMMLCVSLDVSRISWSQDPVPPDAQVEILAAAWWPYLDSTEVELEQLADFGKGVAGLVRFFASKLAETEAAPG